MNIKVYHNPHCSRSRQTLELLHNNNIEPEIIEYLKSPPDAQTLKQLLSDLNMQPRDLIRSKEPEYREQGLDNTRLTKDDLINAMIKTPKLIERPIVRNGNKVTIGRPPEKVLEIL